MYRHRTQRNPNHPQGIRVQELITLKITAKTKEERRKKEIEEIRKKIEMESPKIDKIKQLELRKKELLAYAKEAIYEAPDADAIYIHCPAWPAMSNVDILEKDFGKPVGRG